MTVSEAHPIRRPAAPDYPNGVGDLTLDAWGNPKFVQPFSLCHGLFTYNIPQSQWFLYENGTQVYTSTNITSTNSVANLTTDETNTVLLLESRLCPRYQPNRGHHFSMAGWFPNKTNDGVRDFGLFTTENGVFFRLKADGKLYAVLRSGGSETLEQEIDTSVLTNFDVEKNNIYDIQFQWRSAGNYKFFIGDPLTGTSKLVHEFNLLGTLTAASMENPALPIAFKATRTTEDVVMNIPCADVTSEGGTIESSEYGSAYAEDVSISTNTPVLSLYQPLQVNSETNTRAAKLVRMSFTCDKKAVFKVWLTRDAGNLTGETFKPIAESISTTLQADSPDMDATAVTATAATTASMDLVTVVSVPAGETKLIGLPSETINFYLVRGDIITVTGSAATGTATVIAEWGEVI